MTQPFSDEQWSTLLDNGRRAVDCSDFDPASAVKLFTPDAGATWLLSEVDPDDHPRAFGLCDLSWGLPELGHVSLTELTALRGPLRLPVERDLHFNATKSTCECVREARPSGRITSWRASK